jgi:hypothetical protein
MDERSIIPYLAWKGLPGMEIDRVSHPKSSIDESIE